MKDYDLFDRILITVFVLTGVILFYGLLIWTPVNLYTESKCLAKGYPKAHVDVFLNTDCSNLDGSVTVKVDKLGK